MKIFKGSAPYFVLVKVSCCCKEG